jgi:DNA repair protein RadC
LSKRILKSVDNNLNAIGKLSIRLMLLKALGNQSYFHNCGYGIRTTKKNRGCTREFTKVTSSKVVFEIMQPIIGELPMKNFGSFI